MSKILHIEDWAESPGLIHTRPLPPQTCKECGRTLETEDELATGYCLKALNKSKTWPGVWSCQNNPDNDPLAAAKGALIGVLIMVVAAVMAWGGYQLFVWLK